MDTNSDTNQEIKRKFVHREVIMNIGLTIATILKNPEALNESGYFIEDLYEITGGYKNVVCADQFRYVIDLDERGEFKATVYDIDEDGDDNNEIYNFNLQTEADFERMAEEIDDVSDTDDVWKYLVSNKVITEYSSLIDGCDEPETEEILQEAYEFWAVSEWLGKKLKDHGELVGELLDFTVWGRQTSGQAILLDGVIGEICNDMEILQGQQHEWKV